MTQPDNKHRVPEDKEPSRLRRWATRDFRTMNIPAVPKVALSFALVLVLFVALKYGWAIGSVIGYSHYGVYCNPGGAR